MKEWQETSQVARSIVRALAGGDGVALSTVIAIDGSAYRQPGAKLLVEQSGQTLGGVSGGCLENDVREVALGAVRAQSACLRHYATGSETDTVWGLGLGCEGTVDVFVQPLSAEDGVLWESVIQLLGCQEPFAIVTVFNGTAMGRSIVVASDIVSGTTGHEELDRALVAKARTLVDGGESSVVDVVDSSAFVEVLVPPPWLTIFGAGDDAVPVASLAEMAGFRVAVIDHRPAQLAISRFSKTVTLFKARPESGLPSELDFDRSCYAVVMTHTLTSDRMWAQHLIDTTVPYIGVLGPRARVEKMLDDLSIKGSERVFGPVGLDIGARGSQQIALSIVAEVLSVRSARLPQHLRDRTVAIHAV